MRGKQVAYSITSEKFLAGLFECNLIKYHHARLIITFITTGFFLDSQKNLDTDGCCVVVFVFLLMLWNSRW